MKENILLVGFWPDYESTFFQNIKSNHISVTVINPKEIMEKSLFFHYLPRPIRNNIYKKIILKTIKQNPDKIIIFQEFRLTLELLEKYKPKVRGGIMMRNIIDSQNKIFPLIGLLKNDYPFWSFDKEDCKKYGFNFYNQFIGKLTVKENIPRDIDFVFIGRDKGRKDWLINFKKESEKNGFSTLIDLRTNKKIGFGEKEHKGGTRTYENYLKTQLRGHCILDIVQENQSGMTLRPLEALQYNQKLITNNTSIEDSDIYHESNVYVIEGEVNFKEISDFMQLPFIKIGKNILYSYSTTGVFEGIVQQVLKSK